MVVTSFWTQSWVVPVLTTCIFFALLCFLLCCLCWGNKNGLTDFYEPGECSSKNGSRDFLKNSVNNLMLFRRFSTVNEPKPVFTSNNLPFSKMINVSDPESDLLDSMEEKKSFDNLTLQFDECDERPGAPKEDLRSCISTDSLNTFYSAYPSLVRTNSRNSFISVISDGDLETLIS
ncbi:uncharacterized protein [Leptinotarsa decemlineata]|uniref:uncharacterized protein n=1 Tax=Leptinotarsa decemlineata TaxID=7539 RepID=UPI000C252BA8|nr:uncharacterized protein LOC111515350 [Leptinotarsa decemlineata]